MGWFDDVIKVANPITYATSLGNEIGKLGDKLVGANGGGSSSGMTGKGAIERERDMEAGFKKGRELFYDDPDMQNLRARREDLAKGYSGEELGALRETARGEIAGQRSNYLRNMSTNLARGGVGGARGAAIRGAADRKFAQAGANAERQMALDSGNMVRQGTDALQDFYMRQKLGQVGMGATYGQFGVADRTADAARAANAPQGKSGIFGLGIGPF